MVGVRLVVDGPDLRASSFEGMPDGVALEELVLEDIGGGRTGLTAASLVDSFEDRHGSESWTSSLTQVT